VALEGTFHKWDATLTFTSTELSTGEVTVDLKAKRVSGPPVDLKQTAVYHPFQELQGR
jgi:polyisoprenoid-binding protein YceI